MDTGTPSRLSRRELQIARAFAEGASHRAVGERLFIAPSTVRTHLATIYRKLGVTSKLDLARVLSGAEARPAGAADPGTRRRTIAVMPFAAAGPEEKTLADGLAQDVITRIAKLRGVRVIARGTVFALADSGVGGREAAQVLAADYLASGTVRRIGDRIRVTAELVDARGDEVVWADGFECRADDTFLALDRIGDNVVANVAAEIEAAERNRAIMRNPESLDAWECFHRGLWHMYRFTAADNEEAQTLFRRAVRLDPTFSRAHSGLSFTHFQNAFLLRPEARESEVARALEAAGDSLVADERDPSAHWAMGRALWLKGDDREAASALATSVDLSPNFAMGHYALAFVTCQTGDPAAAVRSADQSLALSPFDPLLFGMNGARAMALFRLGAHAEAAEFAVRAAGRPNAHVHIHAIAALCLAMAGRIEEAAAEAAAIRARAPGYGCDDFLCAFRFPPADAAAFRRAAALAGLA